MEDVRGLIRLDAWVCAISGALALLLTAAGLFRQGPREGFLRGVLIGLRIFAAAAGVLLVWALADFDGLFVTFHRVAFPNGGWLLNPETDLLIRLMPLNFFISLGIQGAMRALAVPVALAAAARIGIHRTRNKEQEA